MNRHLNLTLDQLLAFQNSLAVELDHARGMLGPHSTLVKVVEDELVIIRDAIREKRGEPALAPTPLQRQIDSYNARRRANSRP